MGLQEEVKELKELLVKQLENQEKAKEKKFKYPFGKKVGKGQRKKNYVTVIIAYENSVIEFKKYQIIDQTIIHDTIPRLATAGHVMHDKKGNPVIFLPNWSVEPFSPLEHYQKTLIDGSNTAGYRLLNSRMQTEKVGDKKKMSGWLPWVIGLLILGVILFAVLSGGDGGAATKVVTP